MKTVKVKVHPDTYKIIKKVADEEGDTIEDFLGDHIEGTFGLEENGDELDSTPEIDESVSEAPLALREKSTSSALAHIPEKYRKAVEDMLDEQAKKSRDERMMSALKYVVEMLMTTPGTGDRRDWAQQMLRDICQMNHDPYTRQVEDALDNLLKRSGYMDLFSFGRVKTENPPPSPFPDMMNPGDGK